MLAWQATGLPMGNYAYEYDIFSKNCRFVPFLSMVADAVQTGRKLGHVAMIPEVSLSPRRGPDVYAHAIQNRLSIYLYARLLWDPDEPMSEVLGDWCQTVFGAAAAPMLDYFQTMDRAWTGMPIHATILGNALNTAPHLLTDRLRAEAAAAFVAASGGCRKSPSRRPETGRRLPCSASVRCSTSGWTCTGCTPTRRASACRYWPTAGDFPASASRPLEVVAAGSGNEPSTQVRLAWTNDALLVKWTCRGLRSKEVKAAAGQHDGKGWKTTASSWPCPPASPAKRGISR